MRNDSKREPLPLDVAWTIQLNQLPADTAYQVRQVAILQHATWKPSTSLQFSFGNRIFKFDLSHQFHLLNQRFEWFAALNLNQQQSAQLSRSR